MPFVYIYVFDTRFAQRFQNEFFDLGFERFVFPQFFNVGHGIRLLPCDQRTGKDVLHTFTPIRHPTGFFQSPRINSTDFFNPFQFSQPDGRRSGNDFSRNDFGHPFWQDPSVPSGRILRDLGHGAFARKETQGRGVSGLQRGQGPRQSLQHRHHEDIHENIEKGGSSVRPRNGPCQFRHYVDMRLRRIRAMLRRCSVRDNARPRQGPQTGFEAIFDIDALRRSKTH